MPQAQGGKGAGWGPRTRSLGRGIGQSCPGGLRPGRQGTHGLRTEESPGSGPGRFSFLFSFTLLIFYHQQGLFYNQRGKKKPSRKKKAPTSPWRSRGATLPFKPRRPGSGATSWDAPPVAPAVRLGAVVTCRSAVRTPKVLSEKKSLPLQMSENHVLPLPTPPEGQARNHRHREGGPQPLLSWGGPTGLAGSIPSQGGKALTAGTS